jgi:hypothetical protein
MTAEGITAAAYRDALRSSVDEGSRCCMKATRADTHSALCHRAVALATK